MEMTLFGRFWIVTYMNQVDKQAVLELYKEYLFYHLGI